ncbi:metallophosphoesterase family protein [Brevibacillus sp. NPDC058079]|uniref:metallophosphoesterase family protein n=1 Tax=Brevibacillus sp. NPDC058079 TaxID=3346330 RepID=UPI0036E034A6
MRLLYFGDKHERVTSPENRMDDFVETQRLKTLEIIDIGRRHQVNGFLQPGDFLDSPNVPDNHLAWLMEVWSGVSVYEALRLLTSNSDADKEKALSQLKNYVPLIGVAGNHELYGNNIKTLPKTSIGFLNKVGLMTFATKENPYFFYTEDGAKVAVTGTHYHLDIDAPEHIDDYIVEEKLGDFHIHIVHGYLSDKSMGNMFRHTLIDHIQHTKADLTITGHDHIGFPLTEINGKWFVNPGAIPRTKNDVKEMNRKPKVLLIDITKKNGLQLKEIFLKSAQDGELVLNRRKIVERKKREDRLSEFKKAVRDAGNTKSTDIIEIIRNKAETKELPLIIRDDVIDRISEKKREMSQVVEKVLNNAHVDKIILENFQSHQYTELELSRGLNIFVGESRQGKTAVLRAFRWVYENKPLGDRIIKKGAKYAKVTLFLSNGYIVSRIMEKKSNGRNGYEITDPMTGEVAYHNTKMLPEVQKILGYNPFVIDSDLQFNLNFMKQGSGWFLIGDQFSAPVKAKIIGAIYGTHYADAVARELDAEDRKVNDELKKAQADVQKLDEQIRQYTHLDDLEQTMSNVEGLLKEIEALNQRRDKIVVLINKRKQTEAVIQENEHVISRLQDIEQLSLKLEQVKVQELKRSQLASLLSKRQAVQTKYNLLEEALQALRDLDKAKEMHETVSLLQKQSQEIRQILVRRTRITALIEQENQILTKTQLIDEAYRLLKEVETAQIRRKELQGLAERAKRLELTRKEVSKKLALIDETLAKTKYIEEARKVFDSFAAITKRKSNIEKAMDGRKKIIKQITDDDSTIKKQNNESAILVNKYKSLLEQAGSCPVCYGTIDRVTVNRIAEQFAAS